MEEELFEMEKIVKTRIEYNDFLKKKIESRMEGIQKVEDEKASRVKSKSVLNKSLDTVAGILKMSKWWAWGWLPPLWYLSHLWDQPFHHNVKSSPKASKRKKGKKHLPICLTSGINFYSLPLFWRTQVELRVLGHQSACFCSILSPASTKLPKI